MPRSWTPRRAAIGAGAAATLVLVAACSSTSDPAASGASSTSQAAPSGSTGTTAGGVAADTTGITFPGEDWSEIDAAAAGMDPAVLESVAAEAEAGGSSCFVVTRNGELVDEWYWNGADPSSTQEIFSATKSFTSILTGIAQDEGKLSIDDPAADYISAWQGTPAEAITVKNLLSNNSGRHWDFQTDYLDMATKAPDKTAFAIDLEMDAAPGEVWAYNNAAIQTLDEVLQVATGESPAIYGTEKLLEPIGMADSTWKTDASGNTLTFMGLDSTCRDMARFGTLLLADGTWDGTQVVSADYVDEATSPSQELNEAYGYLIWLNHLGTVANPVQPTTGVEGGSTVGQMVPGAPEDMFFALGLGNQVILVDPASGVVATRIGPVNRPAGSTQFGQGNMARLVTEGLTD
ncbi:MAG: serine hydrolase [Acidimicrobiales bacterium]